MLAGTLGFGTMAFAGGGDGDGDGGREGRRHRRPSAEQLCEHQDDIAARAARAKSASPARVAALTEKRAAAEAAGETRKVAWIDKHLARLAKLSDRIDDRLAKFQTWAAENCS